MKPYYFKLGKKFSVNRSRFLGPAVVSPDALFLVVDIEPVRLGHAAAAFISMTTGPIGAFVGGVTTALLESLRSHPVVIETDLRSFPDEILHDSDWPIRKRRGKCFVIPREAVESVKYSFWGFLIVRTEAARFSIDISMFRAIRVLRQLRAAGWMDQRT